MDKKDIYEHLADIYLDASAKRKKSTKQYPKNARNIIFAGIIAFAAGLLFLARFHNPKARLNSEVALIIASDAIKINFNFNPAKKETYSVDLNRLDMAKFKTLAFSAKNTNYRNHLSLRVEFTSIFNERSQVYVRNIPYHWQDYKLNLSDFKNISDWSEMKTLAIGIEEWNAKEKNGVLYIDNIRFLR